MWNDAWSMTLTTRLIWVAVLLFTLYMGGRQFAETYLPIRQVVVTGTLRPETRAALQPVVERLSGSLFSMDLESAQSKFAAIPWVRRAQISRVWPNRLRVSLVEHVPAAVWNRTAMLNVQGEVFPVEPLPGLTEIQAPEGMELEVARRYSEFDAILVRANLGIAAIQVDARHAWRLRLKEDVWIELGRERMTERLGRFVTFYPLAQSHLAGIRHVDMRYPNGFAVLASQTAERKT